MNIAYFIARIKERFNMLPDKADEQAVIARISGDVTFRGSNLWILIFAIFIASLGLNTNSTAVIIGAMLISPLMGPIIGMGLAVGINDLALLKRSAKNYGVATLISVATATVYFLISPLGEAQSELLARTSPTLYDVFIAFCGGAAGIIAICTGGKGNVITGVAIATALMPPLCTAGFGLATGHLLYFLGAFYLFFINTVFIALATYCGVRLMAFKKHEFMSAERARKAKQILTGIVVVTMIPAAIMTVNIVRDSIFNNNVKRFVQTELTQRGSQILSSTVDKDSLKLSVVSVGKEISEAKQREAQQRMGFYGMKDYRLSVIQGAQSDSMIQLYNEKKNINTMYESDRKRMLELSVQANTLAARLDEYTRYETLAGEIRGEMSTLFPQIRSFSLSQVAEVHRDTIAVSRYVTAIVNTGKSKPLSPAERSRLSAWLRSRIKADSVVVVEMPPVTTKTK